MLPRDVTDAPGREESGEVDQNHHWSLPVTQSIPGPSACCSAPGWGANQRGAWPSEDELSHSSSCNRGDSRPECLDLTETSPLGKSSTSGAGHFHGESESLSELTSPQGGPSPGLTSSWTWLQHTSQEVSVDGRGEQTRRSQLLCFVSERVPRASVPPAALASKLCWEEAAAGVVSS